MLIVDYIWNWSHNKNTLDSFTDCNSIDRSKMIHEGLQHKNVIVVFVNWASLMRVTWYAWAEFRPYDEILLVWSLSWFRWYLLAIILLQFDLRTNIQYINKITLANFSYQSLETRWWVGVDIFHANYGCTFWLLNIYHEEN